MAARIYTVKRKSDGAKRLVRATHPSVAQAHVARSDYETTVATQNDLEELLPKGTKVEDVKAEQQALPGT
jgi:hypothetical protein